MQRRELLMIITKRLIILTCISLGIVGLVFGISLFFQMKLMISWLCLLCGIIGGFVSIQQRLKNITNEELKLLSGSWFQTLLIPIYGGIFAFVLYLIFLSDIIVNPLFPAFKFPEVPLSGISYNYFSHFLMDTIPNSGQDLAKLLFWSFVAGFSERFVPQIINDLQPNVTTENNHDQLNK
jgi:hypothetical protein